jgi:hypothetical protein
VIVLAREYIEANLHAPKPRLNTSGWVYEQIVILKNCITFWKYLDHRMQLVT